MRITNMFHFTENHRYVVRRDFSLSPFDYKVLYLMYQPMIGSDTVSLYQTLYHQISHDALGYSRIEQQRGLFLSMSMEPSEQGRKKLAQLASKLEAIGLLHTYRIYLPDNDEYIYEYVMARPLGPVDFFGNQQLTLLLRDHVGKHMLLSIKNELFQPLATELESATAIKEDVSVPFAEWFRLDSEVVDMEIEEAMEEMAAAAGPTEFSQDLGEQKYDYTDILGRFPYNAANRSHIEQLRYEPQQMDLINYVAQKYELTLVDVCRLLDEDGVFSPNSDVNLDKLQEKARYLFHQHKKRSESRDRFLHKAASEQNVTEEEQEKQVEMAYYLDVPDMFQNKCNIHQYNMIVRNEPYHQLLKRFFPGSVPDRVLKLFERIDINYKLKEEVINVLIHYLMRYNLSWNSGYIETIVTDMLGKQIRTFEQAVDYIRQQRERIEQGGTRRTQINKTRPKTGRPQMQTVTSDNTSSASLSQEDYERILQKARELEDPS